MSSEKLEQALANAFGKAVKIVRSKADDTVNENAIIVAASNIALVLLEIDLDSED